MGNSPYKSKVWVCRGTGISRQNVKYLQGDGAAKAFFTGKAKMNFNCSYIRDTSMWSYNESSIHLAASPESLADCDFICYENETENVFKVNKITRLESVNVNTTRVYYEPDFYHTWIEKVRFGFCLVERRHFMEMDNPFLSFTREPLDVPMMQRVFDMPNLTNKIIDLFATAQVFIYMTSDEYNNSNSSDVQFNMLGGAPFWGKAKGYETFSEVTKHLKSYIDNNGTFSSSQLPILSNIQKVIVAPNELLAPSLVGYKEKLSDDFPLPKARFGKIYSPQYFYGVAISTGSGSSVPIDISRCQINDNNTATLYYDLEGCGGMNPRMRVSIYQYGKTFGVLSENETNVVDLPQLPEVPVNAYVAEKPTFLGMAKAVWSGLEAGAVAGTAAGPEGTAAGAVVGGLVGAGFSGWAALNPKAVNYSVSGASSEMVLAQQLYEMKIVMNIPTPDGLEILNDYFNTYGYTVMKREIPNLKQGANFTYFKTASPITNLNSEIPHIAINDISERLQNGLTVWAVEIGSEENYS